MVFDLHVHSVASRCSSLSLEAILENARRCGLDGVCITDHDTMDMRHQVREGIQEDGLCLLVGMEYATAEGHFLIFGPFEDLHPGLSAEEVLRRVASAGGAAVAAHPFRAGACAHERLIRRGLCTAAERINGRNQPEENREAEQWFERYSLVECGGSDAHTLEELGKVTTRFTAPVSSREDLIHALKNGFATVGMGSLPSCLPEGKMLSGAFIF